VRERVPRSGRMPACDPVPWSCSVRDERVPGVLRDAVTCMRCARWSIRADAFHASRPALSKKNRPVQALTVTGGGYDCDFGQFRTRQIAGKQRHGRRDVMRCGADGQNESNDVAITMEHASTWCITECALVVLKIFEPKPFLRLKRTLACVSAIVSAIRKQFCCPPTRMQSIQWNDHCNAHHVAEYEPILADPNSHVDARRLPSQRRDGVSTGRQAFIPRSFSRYSVGVVDRCLRNSLASQPPLPSPQRRAILSTGRSVSTSKRQHMSMRTYSR
jgi:hypothetical protein